jgi:hypothetical protein
MVNAYKVMVHERRRPFLNPWRSREDNIEIYLIETG